MECLNVPFCEVLRREAKVNQLEASGSHSLAGKIGKIMHTLKETNGGDFSKEKHCTEFGL